MSSNKITDDLQRIDLPDIYLNNSLDAHVTYNQILESICDKIQRIPQIQKLRTHDPELIRLVCNIIENLIDKGNKNNVDKKQLCIDIFIRIFAYNQIEIEILKNIIEFLHSNKKIKRISFLKKSINFLYTAIISSKDNSK